MRQHDVKSFAMHLNRYTCGCSSSTEHVTQVTSINEDNSIQSEQDFSILVKLVSHKNIFDK